MTANKNSGHVVWHDFAAAIRLTTPKAEDFGRRLRERLRQALCGLHGHDALLSFEKHRMFLKCVTCGHESPGWDLNEPRPVASRRSEERPTAMPRPHFTDARRIA